MGTLYKNAILNTIVKLGQERSPHVSPSKMCNDLGLSRSLITKLKDNPDKTINGDTAQKIADYFGVSVDRVLGSAEKEKSPTPEGMELTETQASAVNLIMNMSEDQLRKFIQMAEIALEVSSK